MQREGATLRTMAGRREYVQQEQLDPGVGVGPEPGGQHYLGTAPLTSLNTTRGTAPLTLAWPMSCMPGYCEVINPLL